MINKIKKTKKKFNKYISNTLKEKRDNLLSDDFLEVIEKLNEILKKKIKKNKEIEKQLEDISTSYIFYLYFLKKTVDYYSESENFINMIGTKCIIKNKHLFYEKIQKSIEYCKNVYKTDINETNWILKDVVSYDLKDIEGYYKSKKTNNNYMHYESYNPRYAIILNHTMNSIFITIRGTKSILDAIADLNCDNIRKFGGYVHSGFFFAADALFKKIKDDIIFLLNNQYKDYSICITGHSFAGATATLLSVLIKKEFVKNKIKNKIEVFSFGPGPVFYPLSKFPSEGIELNTFVNNADLIPRISIKNIFKLLHILIKVRVYIKDNNINKLATIYNLKTKNYNEDSLLLFDNILKIINENQSTNIDEKDIQIPGNIYLLTTRLKTKKFQLRKIESAELSYPVLYAGKNFLDDHKIASYKLNFNNLEMKK